MTQLTAPPVARTTRVVVVDDHPIVCDGVRLLLAADPSMEVVGSADRGREAVTLVGSLQPDLVLLDLRLPGSNAPDLVRALRGACSGVKIVLFTAHPDNAVLQPTLEAGVDGCLLKDVGTTDLVPSLHAVMAGRRVYDPRVGARPDLQLHDRLAALSLTRREYEVLRLVATGMTNPEVADRLSLTRNTVKTYLQTTMQKLGARNRVEAIGLAHENLLL